LCSSDFERFPAPEEITYRQALFRTRFDF